MASSTAFNWIFVAKGSLYPLQYSRSTPNPVSNIDSSAISDNDVGNSPFKNFAINLPNGSVMDSISGLPTHRTSFSKQESISESDGFGTPMVFLLL